MLSSVAKYLETQESNAASSHGLIPRLLQTWDGTDLEEGTRDGSLQCLFWCATYTLIVTCTVNNAGPFYPIHQSCNNNSDCVHIVPIEL